MLKAKRREASLPHKCTIKAVSRKLREVFRKRKPAQAGLPEPGRKLRNRLLLTSVGEELVHANHLAMHCAGDKSLALDLAGEGLCDSDAIDLEGAAKSALIVGFVFFKIRERAQFGALGRDEIALRQNDVVDCRSAKLVLLLFGLKRLLLQFAGFDGGFNLGASLRESDVRVPNVEQSGVSQLLELRLELMLNEQRPRVVG